MSAALPTLKIEFPESLPVSGKRDEIMPALTALPRTALLESAGPRVSLLQAPTVPLHAPRWRIQLTADHSPADIDDLAELIRDVTRAFDRRFVHPRVPA